MDPLLDNGMVRVALDIQLEYEVYGNPAGKPVIVVNDFFSAKRIWIRYLSGLLQQYKLVIYDLRYSGNITIADHTADLHQIIETLQLEDPVIIGSSASTLICKEFAVKFPRMLSALVMISPFFSPFGNERKQLIVSTWIKVLEGAGPDVFYRLLFGQLLSCRVVNECRRISFLAQQTIFSSINPEARIAKILQLCLQHEERTEDLRKIRTPTLIIAGEQDFFNAPSSIRLLGKLIDDAKVDILDFCGHLPYFESNVLFEKKLLHFLQQTVQKRESSLQSL